MSLDVKAFSEVVETRRSVRKYTSEQVPEDVMRTCLDLALLAPNSSNLQPWEFYWVRSPERRQALNTAFLSQPAAVTAAELVVCVARTKTWKRNSRQLLKIIEAQPNPPKPLLMYYGKLVPFVYGERVRLPREQFVFEV